MQEGYHALPKDLDIPLLDCYEKTADNWLAVRTVLEEVPRSTKSLSKLEDVLTEYVISVGPYIAAILRSSEDEATAVRVGSLLDLYHSLDIERVDTIEELFPDLSGVVTTTERDAYYDEFEEIIEESDSDSEMLAQLHSIFIHDIEADMQAALASKKVSKRFKIDKTRMAVLSEVLDVAKVAAGTAIGFMIVKKLTRRERH